MSAAHIDTVRDRLDRYLLTEDSLDNAAKLHRFALRYKKLMEWPTKQAAISPFFFTLQHRKFNKAFALLHAGLTKKPSTMFSKHTHMFTKQVLVMLSYNAKPFNEYEIKQAFILLKYLTLRGLKFTEANSSASVLSRINIAARPIDDQLSIMLQILAEVQNNKLKPNQLP